MSVGDWMKPGLSMKQWVKIATVDPSTRRIEGVLKDNSMIQVTVWETPPFFTWPQPDEYWSVSKLNGYWVLGARMEVDPDEHSVEALAPGDAKVASDTIYTPSGDTLVTSSFTDKFRTERVTTATITAGSAQELTATFNPPFADTNYTVVASVREATSGSNSLSVKQIVSRASDKVVVRIFNESGSSKSGTLHVIAIAD